MDVHNYKLIEISLAATLHHEICEHVQGNFTILGLVRDYVVVLLELKLNGKDVIFSVINHQDARLAMTVVDHFAAMHGFFVFSFADDREVARRFIPLRVRMVMIVLFFSVFLIDADVVDLVLLLLFYDVFVDWRITRFVSYDRRFRLRVGVTWRA